MEEEDDLVAVERSTGEDGAGEADRRGEAERSPWRDALLCRPRAVLGAAGGGSAKKRRHSHQRCCVCCGELDRRLSTSEKRSVRRLRRFSCESSASRFHLWYSLYSAYDAASVDTPMAMCCLLNGLTMDVELCTLGLGCCAKLGAAASSGADDGDSCSG